MKNACGHQETTGAMRVCPHLVAREEGECFRVLRGQQSLYDLCCSACAALAKADQALDFVSVCLPCVEKLDGNGVNISGWIGKPEVQEQPRAFDDSLISVSFPESLARCLAVVPLDEDRVLGFDGQAIHLYEPHGVSPIIELDWPHEQSEDWAGRTLKPRFCVSQNWQFVALINDYGRFGQVIDLKEAHVTMFLDRGDYHPETQPFPAAFFRKDGRDFLIHAVAWNRLEVSDPQTTEFQTARDAMHYESGDGRPEHYLDYFHGRLRVSPDNKWVCDDGWVWQPFGSIAIWNLDAWLENNPFESEDGSSKRQLGYREAWDIPMCWLDENRLCVSGIGDDDELIDGVQVFDVADGRIVKMFAGPRGSMWSDGARLFSVEERDLHTWDVEIGARTGIIKDFAPQFQIDNALVELDGSLMKIWRF